VPIHALLVAHGAVNSPAFLEGGQHPARARSLSRLLLTPESFGVTGRARSVTRSAASASSRGSAATGTASRVSRSSL
jgi:hypothetical protein